MLFIFPLTIHAEPVKRGILAIIDGDEIKGESDNFIAKAAEMPLNHLGFKLTYVDADKEQLPNDQEMKKYAGVITWFRDNQLRNAPQYAKWATRQLNNGIKFVIFGDFGFAYDEKMNLTSDEIVYNFYKAFKIKLDPEQTTDSPLLLEIVHNNPEMTEFERSLEGSLLFFENIRVLDNNNEIYLQLKRKDTGVLGDIIFTHSRGGFALYGYEVYNNITLDQSRWRINPFKFFEKAFDSNFPKPDVSTLNGIRFFYSHIDGDGIRNISYTDKKTMSGEIVYKQLLTQYDLPITASVLIGDFLKSGTYEKRKLDLLTKNIFKLPNIEPASHGWAHPFIWEKEKRKLALKLSGYEYSPENEIGKSIEYINEHFLPPGEKTNIFLWTGDCRPDYEALKYVYDHNIMNLNGGDTRFDDKYPSYIYVAPLFRHVNGLLQYYTSDANEVTFTNIWTGPFYGYREIIQTFANTESPIRLRPIDVYYHFYIGEYDVSLDTVKNAYLWALHHEIAPGFASDYIKIADGFLSTEIEKVTTNLWKIRNNGHLNTIRFDNYTGYVDLNNSKGVLGFINYQGSLYVHLTNNDYSEIQLTQTPPSRPYIQKANGRVKDWFITNNNSDFNLKTMGRIHFEIASLNPNTNYTVNLTRELDLKTRPWLGWLDINWKNRTYTIKTDNKGLLILKKNILSNRFEWVNITIQ